MYVHVYNSVKIVTMDDDVDDVDDPTWSIATRMQRTMYKFDKMRTYKNMCLCRSSTSSSSSSTRREMKAFKHQNIFTVERASEWHRDNNSQSWLLVG